jgi:spoIIIJ-associated protein
VAPRVQRPKQERRDRRRRTGSSKGSTSSGSSGRGSASRPAGRNEPSAPEGETSESAGAGRSRSKGADRAAPKGAERAEPKGTAVDETVSAEAQADLMAPFLEGLVQAFGQTATIERTTIDDETVELQISGDDLGLLIGPKGQTLQAVQDLARTVVQRRAPGTHEGRVRVDVGGYRQRRREALARFATQVADEVRASGESKALEPMGPADRKIVHDTINELDGVRTTSEGEDANRRVRILPAD